MRRLFGILSMLVILCAFNLSAFAGINDGLIAYYSFNGNANDESENEGVGYANGV